MTFSNSHGLLLKKINILFKKIMKLTLKEKYNNTFLYTFTLILNLYIYIFKLIIKKYKSKLFVFIFNYFAYINILKENCGKYNTVLFI